MENVIKANIVKTPRQVVTTVYDETVEISMPFEVAQTLLTLFNSVGGDPTETGRGDIDKVSQALMAVGVRYTNKHQFETVGSSLHFKRKK